MKRLILVLAALGTAAAQPMSQPFCTTQTLIGTYSAVYEGWTMMMQGGQPVSLFGTILGVISINADGTVGGAAAVSGLGPVADYEVTGTVEVKNDCVGKLTLKVKPKGSDAEPMTEIDRFIFVDDPQGATMLVTVVDLGEAYYPAIVGTWKRLSRRPNVMSW